LLLSLLAAFLLSLLACQGHSPKNILRQEASSYRFSLVGWHLKNLPAKVSSLIPKVDALPTPQERSVLLNDFFNLQSEMARLERELARGTVLHDSSSETLEEKLHEMRLKYVSLAPQVEAIMEKEITHVMATEGVGFQVMGRYFHFPPVLFVFQQPPNLLVASPRDHIERVADQLLSPSMTISEFELVEHRLACYDNLSAIVVRLGGIASYPSIVNENSGFYRSIFLAAHEWAHQYLFFYPLGRAYFDGGIGHELNETVADMIGYEVADRIYRRYGHEPPPRQPPTTATGFDFNAEMRQTRLVAERLLKEGKIDEAEQYMEERRQLFVQEGYNIRKLNQAYFAFHGTYAFDPASVSPVGEQLEELRDYCATLGQFILAVRDLRTHDQLLDLLNKRRSEAFASVSNIQTFY